MTDLVKIREVTERYNIPARTLRYYEDMGLIESARVADYAYRLYDQRALKRLEQILILRKPNISIKDIQLIFQAAGSDTVLDVLGRKVEDINHEVALLRDLRDIILEFIEQIRKMDFSSDSDVKLLYERAATVETRIEKIPYEGNASKVNRLFDISEKLKKAPEVRLVQINPFKAFTSGADTIENVMGPFQEWTRPPGYGRWRTVSRQRRWPPMSSSSSRAGSMPRPCRWTATTTSATGSTQAS